nr:S1 RNA-binding domain-containing protein [Acidobacteriota bacterium]
MTEEQQQTTTPDAAAQDAPVEAAEALATADPAVAVVEEMAAAEAAEELADEAIVADAIAEGLVVEALEAEAASEELAVEAAVADAVAEALVAEAVVAEAASDDLAGDALAAEAAGDGDAAEVLAAESFAADAAAEDLVAEAVVAQDAAEVLAAESFAADAVAGELVAEAAIVEAAAEELAEEAVVAEAVADDLAAEMADEVAHAPAAEPPAPLGPEPSTMAELLAEQDADIRSFKHGDVVEGTVVRIDRDEILVDIGAKSEGVVSNRELYGRNAETAPTLAIGDTVLVYVLQPESPEGHVVLSLRRAGLERKWRSMQEQFEAGVIIEAPVIDHNKGGLIVDCGIRGFVPISQIVDFPRRPQNEQPRDAAQEIAEKLQPYVGRRLRLKILEVNRKANRLILSEKVALYEERREKRDELFSSLQVGQKVTGSVRSIAPFGVFIDLGGIDGLVHKSELSWNKVNNPEAGYKVGDEVEAEVIDINHE